MTNAVVPFRQSAALSLGDLAPSQLEVLRKWVAPDLTDGERQAFMAYCAAMGMDPFARECHVWKDNKGKIVTYPAIDFMRSRAGDTGEYQGQTKFEYTKDGDQWVTVWLEDSPPAAVRVGVWRKGFREPLPGMSVYKKDNRKINRWLSDPVGMMEVRAEYRALKRAFPRETDNARREQHEIAQEYGFEVADTDAPQPYIDTTTGEIVEERRDESPPDTAPTPAPKPKTPPPADDWKAEAAATWTRVKAWASEHGTDPVRLRYYVATDKGIPEKLTESAFKAWLDAEPGRTFAGLYELYVAGEQNPVEGAGPTDFADDAPDGVQAELGA